MDNYINRWPAKLDVIQGVTGLILVLFMWGHMLFVSSILISKDAMHWVAKMFEGVPIFGKPYPGIVTFVGLVVLALLMLHALLALRKFPNSYQNHLNLLKHMKRIKHPDTWLWFIQVVSGFLLFFMATIHLYQMIMHPGDIGPYASSDRVWSGRVWPLYLIMLFTVEAHAGIGIYRLALKWGVAGKYIDKKQRHTLHTLKWAITLFFITLGLLTLAAYMKIGYQHQDNNGERYVPQHERAINEKSLLEQKATPFSQEH